VTVKVEVKKKEVADQAVVRARTRPIIRVKVWKGRGKDKQVVCDVEGMSLTHWRVGS
jgi:hypothetical protein